jgi:DeoR family suf operon transcriptional repressor
MTYLWDLRNSSAGRVLRAIQLRGRASIKDLAADLSVTPSAVRPQIAQLQASGVIRADKVHEGVGRPHYLYSATPEGYGLLSRDYGAFTELLLGEVARTQGPEALQVVLRRVGDRLADTYRPQVRGRELADRTRAWAELLDERGVAVKIEKTPQGYVLEMYGCAYLNIAVEHREVCEMEQQVMARLLESGVKLTQCVLDGYDGCRFAIVKET